MTGYENNAYLLKIYGEFREAQRKYNSLGPPDLLGYASLFLFDYL